MAKVAFELRSDFSDFSGGSVSLPDGSTFDVGAALSDGRVVLDAEKDSQTVDALANYPALKRVAASSKSSGKGDA